jgi:STE24 endopeptidase
MHDERTAARYHRIRLVLDGIGIALGAAFILIVVFAGGGLALASVAARVSENRWWQVAFIAGALAVGHAVLLFPLRYLRGFVLPRRYGLLHQPFASWLGDRLKAAALGAVFGLLVIEAIELLLALTSLWWLVAAAFVIALSALTAAIFPIWILPLFYRLTPLEDASLRDRLLALAARAGVPAVGVFVVDESRKSRTANAALAGLGRTRRIVLFDTLVSQFQPREIESVLAHELGHHVHRDVARGLAAQSVIAVVTFWLADVILRATAGTVGPVAPSDPAGIPWLVAVLGALGFIAVPIANFLSRRVERQADDFALAMTGDAAGFIGAMERLAELNLARMTPSRLEEIVLYSHPSVGRRIARARALTANA